MKIPYLIETLAGAGIALHAIAASSNEVSTPYAQLVEAIPTRITIGQAIVIAEKEVGGEAVEAELEKENGQLIYDIDVNTLRGRMEVLVDPETGAVLSVGLDE